jgi:hypothetical protein
MKEEAKDHKDVATKEEKNAKSKFVVVGPVAQSV